MGLLSKISSKGDDLARRIAENPIIQLAVTSHRPSRGDACLTFDNRPWLIEPYLCNDAEVVWRKCVQIGISELLIIRTLYYAGVKGLGILYLLPTLLLRDRFVRARVNGAIKKSPEYRRIQAQTGVIGENAKLADAVALKVFGKGPIYFVGSNSPTGVVECGVDYIIIDELDRCLPETAAMAYDRYSSSPLKWSWKVGNPSFEDFGISEAFDHSSQKHWFIRCDHCRKWCTLDFFRHIVREVDTGKYEARDREWVAGGPVDLRPICQKCEKPLDRFAWGEWVAKFPSRSIVGWTMSQLYSPMTGLGRLLTSRDQGFFAALGDEYKTQLFFNSILGLPYSPKGTSLSAPILRKCEASHIGAAYVQQSGSRRPTTMGVDVGASILNVSISDHPERDGKRYSRLLHVCRVREFEELDDLLKRFSVDLCVVDVDPEARKAKEFQHKHFGKVWLVSLVDPATRNATPAYVFDDENHVVTANRTQMLDACVAGFLNGTVLLPDHSEKLDDGTWEAQVCAPKRQIDEKAVLKRFRWDAAGRPDHYLFAASYDMIADLLKQRGYSSSLAADPNFSMFPQDEEADSEMDDIEELMDFVSPERAKQRKAPGGPGDDGWGL